MDAEVILQNKFPSNTTFIVITNIISSTSFTKCRHLQNQNVKALSNVEGVFEVSVCKELLEGA